MTIKFLNTASISANHGIKVLVYGNAGVGKTRLLASAPNPVILSAESGLMSLRQFQIPAVQIYTLKDLTETYEYMLTPAAKQFQTICLDSVSDIAEVCLAHAKSQTKDGRKAYGDAQDWMIDIFRKFRDISGKHIVFIAKQEYNVDGQTGAKAFQPSFPGNKLSQAVPYFFDEVWQLNRFKGQDGVSNIWALRTAPDQFNQAKDRSGSLAEWENADPVTGGGLSYLFNKILSS